MVWFVPFSQKPHFSFFLIKMYTLEKLNNWCLIHKMLSLKEKDPKLFCDAKFENKLIF